MGKRRSNLIAPTLPETLADEKLIFFTLVLAVAGAAAWYVLGLRDPAAQKQSLDDIRNSGTAPMSWLTDRVSSVTEPPGADPTRLYQQPSIAAADGLDRAVHFSAQSAAWSPNGVAERAGEQQACAMLDAQAKPQIASRPIRGRYMLNLPNAAGEAQAPVLMAASLTLPGSPLLLQSTFAAGNFVDISAY